MGQHKTKLSAKELRDLVSSTEFTETEIRSWYKSFLREWPSGNLTLEQFKKCYASLFTSGDSAEYAERVFRSFDTNESGTIDFREFICAVSVTSHGDYEQKLRWGFRMYDNDNDGYITKDEVQMMIEAVYKLVGDERLTEIMPVYLTAAQRAEIIFSKMDKDGDEHVTVEEFTLAATKDPSLTMLFQLGGQSRQQS